MALTPLIIDRQGPVTAGGEQLQSLLGLPLGRHTLLAHLGLALAEVTRERLVVLPTFPVDEAYHKQMKEGRAEVLLPEDLEAWIRSKEPADMVLIMDAAQLPAEDFDFPATVDRMGRYRGVTHVVAVGSNTEDTHEQLEFDVAGRVRRVQRYFSMVNLPALANTTLFMSLVPVHCLDGKPFDSLAALRASLTSRGMLCRDEPLHMDVVDLTREAGVLAFNERVLTAALSESHGGYQRRQQGVLVGADVKVHPSARLIGPLVIQDGVRIDERVTIIGPAVIGVNTHIRREATVAQAVVARGTDVKVGATIRHRVASGTCDTLRSCSVYADEAATAIQRIDRQLNPAHNRGQVSHDFLAGRRAALFAKRAFDILSSSAAILILSPLMILVAVLLKLGSRGPIFFVHCREQRGGQEFRCLKFRTMVPDAHERQRELYESSEVDGPQFKITNDPRVTPFGRFLRATNIDELPQLFNVLLGHMSVIGPRPSPFRENQICVPWRRARLSVRPGITGLWQVCRSDDRSQGDFHEWIYYDITYVRNFSSWLDIKILLATVLTCGGRWSVPLRWLVRTEDPAPAMAMPAPAIQPSSSS